MAPQLRPAQARVLEYREGKMAVSAVPGSGKTFTLARLAATLIAEGQVDAEAGQQVLVVTYLNASVETFRARIRQRLQAMDLPLLGYDVRTLHSLGLEIVRTETSGIGDELIVLDEAQADHYLNRAVNDWIDENAALWHAFLPDEDSVQMRTRWRDVTERTAKSFIRAAKNDRYRPQAILNRLMAKTQEPEPDDGSPLPSDYSLPYMLNGIYARYQSILNRQAAMDFDDLIWRAADLLEARPTTAIDFAVACCQRLPADSIDAYNPG
jgi:DNA helicase-2/ATP-dependent DNA helicase PcrA